MKRLLRCAVLVTVALITAVVTATSASADIGGGSPPPPPPGGGGQQNGGGGGHVHQTVRNCSLYANSSGFGAACISGSEGDARTVKQILKHDPAPTCWDDPISDADAKSIYGYDPNPDGRPYFLHSCITGLNVNSTLYYQPDLNLNQTVILLPVNPPNCDVKKQPYTDAQVGTCREVLTTHQHTVVNFITSKPANIPPLLIVERPSTTVRTNENVAYVNLGSTDTVPAGQKTVTLTVGNVTLTARMNANYIYPYGPGGQRKKCDASIDPGTNGTPASSPGACWWSYPASSAAQPGQVYDFRLATSWTVTYAFAGGGGGTLATVSKYDDLQLPVDDVQTVVVR